ncbi:MAG: hypothetical protein J0H67_10180 [Rhodospirillales bacterium]|nr:hypothetical protein [Rhodospirillales bacterium]
MLPPPTDPRWRNWLTSQQEPKFTVLASKVLLGRLRQDVQRNPGRLDAAVEELRAFFASNSFAQRDL